MATQTKQVAHFGPAWCSRRVLTFAGQFDTHIQTGEDYATLTLAELFMMEPGNDAKGAGPAFIPSSYNDYDGREHARQREVGEFVALCADIDKDDHPLFYIESLVRGFCGDAAWLIYSSANARPGNMRWRVVIPLADPAPFDEWHDAQHALFAFLETSGVEVDRSLDRAAQPVYLPNVPEFHAKSGERLRAETGEALFYARATSGCTAPGIETSKGPLGSGIAEIRRRQAEDDRDRERIRKEAEARQANRPRVEGAPIMEEFNKSTSIATLFELYGYTQSPRNPDDWRSPHQTTDSYATRIMGDKWVSLSASDAGARLGENCKAGCFGDAYDLFVHYEHGGDHKAAHRKLYSERRTAALPQMPPPPPAQEGDPGWTEAPAEVEAEHDAAEAFAASFEAIEAEPRELALFDPSEWVGQQPPEREWRWQDFMPDGQATLLTGAGAAGKSLATQQMATCIAMGLPFLGIETKEAPALYITCEDDLGELHRRQKAICEMLGIPLAATSGRLFLLSLQGEIGNELATFSNEGELSIAPRFHEIEAACLTNGIRHVTLDNTAHTFAGNENDRHQVAAFVNLNNRLARNIGGSVLMVGHPNKAGASYSGSTAWENQVRARLFLEVPLNAEGGPIDPDMRLLRNEKANYSQRGSEVTFYWLKGAFVTDDQMPTGSEKAMRETAQASYENDLFLRLLDALTAQKRHVSHSPNVGNYAPKVMAGMPEARGVSKANLARAMERLFGLNKIIASAPLWKGRDRHPVLGLARAAASGSAN